MKKLTKDQEIRKLKKELKEAKEFIKNTGSSFELLIEEQEKESIEMSNSNRKLMHVISNLEKEREDLRTEIKSNSEFKDRVVECIDDFVKLEHGEYLPGFVGVVDFPNSKLPIELRFLKIIRNKITLD